MNIEKDNHLRGGVVISIRFHHWIRFSLLAALEVVRMTTFNASGDGGFGRSNDVSVLVMHDAIEAASFRFQTQTQTQTSLFNKNIYKYHIRFTWVS